MCMCKHIEKQFGKLIFITFVASGRKKILPKWKRRKNEIEGE